MSLPRTSQAQYGVGRYVSKSELALGDLVFFYSGLSHVALYAGHGLVTSTPSPRQLEHAATVIIVPKRDRRATRTDPAPPHSGHVV